jgi:oxygen-dependent protoporphyrinogen oxidase
MTGTLAALVRELGLEREVVYAPEGLPLYVYADGALREVPFSLRSLVTGDLLTWRGKLRLAWEPLTARPRDDERVSALFTRKLGREAYERLAGPLYGGLYASDPADMVVGLSLGNVLRELGVRRSLQFALLRRGGRVSPPAACSFREGLQTLTNALHAEHAETVRLGRPARGLQRSGSGWTMETEEGEVEVQVVVLTCDAPAAARLLEVVAPEAATRLRRLVYNPLAVVHLHAPETDLRGLGYQVALGEELVTRGVTWNASLFGGDRLGREGVHTAFLGGAKSPEAVEEPDDRLGKIAAAEFRRVNGHAARVLTVSRAKMPAWDASWRALEGLSLPPGIRVAASWQGRPGIPGRLVKAIRLGEELTTFRL